MPFPLVDDAGFESEVLQCARPVFVKFSATWCAPCKAIAPIVESLAANYANEMKFVDVDIDDAPGVTQRYGIRGVPTMIIFNGGQIVVRDTAGQSRTRIAEMIEAALEGGPA